MDSLLLEQLVCPITLDRLEVTQPKPTCGAELRQSATCELRSASGKTFPVRSGVPTFLSDEKLPDQTLRSFRDKWRQHRYYRNHTRRFYTEWYLQRYGFVDAGGLRSFLADKAWILDAGTGSGRDALNFAECGHGCVYGVDTAFEPLEAAAREGLHDRLGFVHADLHHLPFRDDFFDFINCDQVIHHTPDPRTAFLALARKLKRGGVICCYVYKKKAAIREYVDDYVRAQISSLPFAEALTACEPITKLGQALSSLRASVDIPEDIPLLGIKKGASDVQRFIHWNMMKCFWNDEFDFATNNLINCDWYHPEHCHRLTPEEFRAWFANGWEIQAWDVQDAGISCRARKL